MRRQRVGGTSTDNSQNTSNEIAIFQNLTHVLHSYKSYHEFVFFKWDYITESAYWIILLSHWAREKHLNILYEHLRSCSEPIGRWMYHNTIPHKPLQGVVDVKASKYSNAFPNVFFLERLFYIFQRRNVITVRDILAWNMGHLYISWRLTGDYVSDSVQHFAADQEFIDQNRTHNLSKDEHFLWMMVERKRSRDKLWD